MPTTSGRMFPAETRGMNLCCNSADVPPKKQSWRVWAPGGRSGWHQRAARGHPTYSAVVVLPRVGTATPLVRSGGGPYPHKETGPSYRTAGGRRTGDARLGGTGGDPGSGCH